MVKYVYKHAILEIKTIVNQPLSEKKLKIGSEAAKTRSQCVRECWCCVAQAWEEWKRFWIQWGDQQWHGGLLYSTTKFLPGFFGAYFSVKHPVFVYLAKAVRYSCAWWVHPGHTIHLHGKARCQQACRFVVAQLQSTGHELCSLGPSCPVMSQLMLLCSSVTVTSFGLGKVTDGGGGMASVE